MTEWEERYRRGDTPWEKGAPHPALVAWLEKHALTGRVLVPGCGSGHDVRALAARGAEVVGLDIAPSAIRAARHHLPVGRESYEVGDFFRPPAAWRGAFDGLFEHTCFCAIDPSLREAYARSAATVLRPGGHFLAIFYLDPGPEDGPPFGCTKAGLDVLFSPAFRLLEERDMLPTHPGREGREILRLYERLPDSVGKTAAGQVG
jgi:2-polyprenyl-3-methyl-5-hydroxy-6-metoxy-1,4-benzoquinol methylase